MPEFIQIDQPKYIREKMERVKSATVGKPRFARTCRTEYKQE
jgi:hypothetical protein